MQTMIKLDDLSQMIKSKSEDNWARYSACPANKNWHMEMHHSPSQLKNAWCLDPIKSIWMVESARI